MPPRKKAAPKKKAAAEVPVEVAEEVPAEVEEEPVVAEETAPEPESEPAPVVEKEKKSKGKGKAKAVEEDEVVAPVAEVVESVGAGATEVEAGEEGGEEDEVVKPVVAALTPAERMAKMKELRQRMADSNKANRAALITEHQKQKTTARELFKLGKQKKLAENLREQLEAEETGEDLERRKNWEWTVEDGEKWDEKMRIKDEKSNFEFDDSDSNAQRKYVKNLTTLKPDLHAYNLQKEAALGLAPGKLVPIKSGSGSGEPSSSSSGHKGLISASAHARAIATSSKALSAAEALYRDKNTLVYGDDKPTEEAIDRVVGKMNADAAKANKNKLKRSRAEETGDVTYINEANKVFNKKINRYFDKYTSEIRANFERGTAL